MEKEHGICEVQTEKSEKYGPLTVGVVIFKEPYPTKPQISLTASQESRPDKWVALTCSILELDENHMVIDFDGWKRDEDGTVEFQQEVYPGAKCYWNVL